MPVSVAYQSDGRIAGRIVDANGLPASKVSVSAFPSRFTTKNEYPEVSMQTKITDTDGRYEIGPLPSGEYQVGVNVEWPAGLESPYPPTYFPGVVMRAQAETITVREGEMRRANFVLPQELARCHGPRARRLSRRNAGTQRQRGPRRGSCQRRLCHSYRSIRLVHAYWAERIYLLRAGVVLHLTRKQRVSGNHPLAYRRASDRREAGSEESLAR